MKLKNIQSPLSLGGRGFRVRGIIVFLFYTLLFPMLVHAQTPSEGGRFTVSIVGTTNFSDVDIIAKNLKRSTLISELTPTLSSRELIEYSGTYTSSPEALIEEIRGLAQDRFAVEVPKQKGKSAANILLITLRKLAR